MIYTYNYLFTGLGVALLVQAQGYKAEDREFDWKVSLT